MTSPCPHLRWRVASPHKDLDPLAVPGRCLDCGAERRNFKNTLEYDYNPVMRRMTDLIRASRTEQDSRLSVALAMTDEGGKG